jgi:hypothetical protein
MSLENPRPDTRARVLPEGIAEVDVGPRAEGGPVTERQPAAVGLVADGRGVATRETRRHDGADASGEDERARAPFRPPSAAAPRGTT